MSDFKNSQERLEAYNTENIEFKDKARRLITKNLGFEPDLKASLGIELLMREMLKNLYLQKISRKRFNVNYKILCNTVRSLIKDRAPEQVYLLEKKQSSVSYLYLGLGFLGLCLLGVLAFFWFG